VANNPVPTIGTQDFITDSANKFAQLFTDFLVSDYNQTYLYPGEVTSAPYLVQQAGSDENAQVRIFQDALSKYFRRYYDDVSVTVTASDLKDSTLQGGTNLAVVIQLTENLTQVTYGRMITTANNLITNVTNLINYGKTA
jgi:hypothetical protein